MADPIEQGLQRVPLAPRHKRYFDMKYALPHYFNTPTKILVPPDFNFEAMKEAFRYLLQQHDSLRLRFRQDNGEWQAFIAAASKGSAEFEVLDLSGVEPDLQASEMDREGARVQGSLNLQDGPVLKVVHINFGSSVPGRLVVVTHHMLVDGFSTTILMEDVRTLYAQALSGQAFSLPQSGVTYRQWVERMQALAQSGEIRQEYPYWQRLRDCPPVPLPLDHDLGPNNETSLMSVTRYLSVEETSTLMRSCLKKLKVSIIDALLTALALSAKSWTGQNTLWVEMTHHGRDLLPDELDLTRTVGLLTANFPIVLEVGDAENLHDSLLRIQRIRDAVPNKGAGYGLLRYMTEDEDIASGMRAVPRADVNFNYVGYVPGETSYEAPKERFGPHRYAEHVRPNLVSCKAMVKGERLIVGWESSANLQKKETLTQLADDYMECIREIMRLSAPIP